MKTKVENKIINTKRHRNFKDEDITQKILVDKEVRHDFVLKDNDVALANSIAKEEGVGYLAAVEIMLREALECLHVFKNIK